MSVRDKVRKQANSPMDIKIPERTKWQYGQFQPIGGHKARNPGGEWQQSFAKGNGVRGRGSVGCRWRYLCQLLLVKWKNSVFYFSKTTTVLPYYILPCMSPLPSQRTHFICDTCSHQVCRVFLHTKQFSPTLAEWPTIQLNSDVI